MLYKTCRLLALLSFSLTLLTLRGVTLFGKLCPKIEIVFVGAREAAARRPFGDQFVLLAANGVSV